MIYCKIFQSDERLMTTIPTAQAIQILRHLQTASLREPKARDHLDRETVIRIFLEQPRLLTIQQIVSRPATPEDDIDYLETDGAIDTLEETRQQLVTIELVLSLLRRKSAAPPIEMVEPDPFAAALPDMPTSVEHIGPMLFRLEPGTATPRGASPSDPLTTREAANLYNLIHGAEEAINRERKRLGMPTIEAVSANEVLRSRYLFLLRLRGHHFRERFPLGHNCSPLSTHLEYLFEMEKLYVELVKKNTTKFFRYPILFARFSQFFEGQLLQLARDKKQGKASLDQKIRVLDIGVSTGEEPISIVLTAALCLEAQRSRLTAILGEDPGQIGNWLEIIGTEKKGRYCEDIEQFLTRACYPKEFVDEIPSEYLEPARKYGFIIEQGDTFHFSPAIMAPIKITFINFFEQNSLEHPIFDSTYDAMFYIKVLEYLITDPQNVAEAEAGQLFLYAFDSGALLKQGGYFFTDGNKIRQSWTELIKLTSFQSLLHAALRRSVPGIEKLLGPQQTLSDDPIEMLNQGELMLPMRAEPLLSKSFTGVMTNYPMDEVAVFSATDKISTQADFVRQRIQRLERIQKAIKRDLSQGLPPKIKEALKTQNQAIESLLKMARQELKQLEGGAK